MPIEQARAAALAAQGLASCRNVVDAIERTGFFRTLGGVEVYAAARARVKSFKAKDLDSALASRRVQVVPAVRGCMYLVAERDVPYALRLADLLGRRTFDRNNEKAGVKREELEKLGETIATLLAKKGALSTDEIRKSLPEDAIRSLGEKGKRVGVSSTLPPALRVLEFAGRIDRLPETGRLDTERYVWRATKGRKLDAPDSIAEILPHMAEIFLRGAGFGTAKDFAAWAGVSQREASLAFEAIHSIDVAGWGHALEELGSRTASNATALLPFEDNLIAYHGGPALMTETRHHSMQVPSWGSTAKGPLGAARHLAHRPAIAEGRLVGFWEYDPKAKTVVVGCFDAISVEARRALDEEADALGRMLAGEIGHGRSFSLDTDEECAKRAAWVRSLKSPVKRT